MTRNFSILSIFCLLILSPFIHAQYEFDSIVSKFVNYSGFKGSSIGIYAMDADSKQVLMNFESDKLLSPASTVKLFSTALAFETVGGSFRPSTQLYYNGTIHDSILTGDIWIIGGGDMSLGSRYFESANRTDFLQKWVAEVKTGGIRQINGNIYVDGSNFGYEGAPDDWLWADIGNYYGAHFSGAMIFDNILEYHFKTNASGKPAVLTAMYPVIDTFQFVNNVKGSTKSGDNSYIFGAPYTNAREARGTLPQNTPLFIVKGSLPDPEKQLAVEFRKMLLSRGVVHNGFPFSTRTTSLLRPIDSWTLLMEYKGKTISEIAKATNFESINVFAEGLMRLSSFQIAQNGTHEHSRDFMLHFWKGKLNETELFLSDGSGLSRTNSVKAKTFCELLAYMHQSKNNADFYASLPVSGVSGTLKNLTKNQLAQGKIHAKSGTMKRTKSYVGYAETQSGKKIAFAFIVNNYSCSNKDVTLQMETLMNELVKK